MKDGVSRQRMAPKHTDLRVGRRGAANAQRAVAARQEEARPAGIESEFGNDAVPASIIGAILVRSRNGLRSGARLERESNWRARPSFQGEMDWLRGALGRAGAVAGS